MERIACAMRPSSFSVHCTYEPRPIGMPRAAATIVPPSVAPVLEVAVADDDRDRRPERLSPADATGDLHLVRLDLHPAAAAVAVLPALQVEVDPIAIEPHPRGHAGDDDGELRAVRLAGRD